MTKMKQTVAIVLISISMCVLFLGMGGIFGWQLTLESQKPKEVEIVPKEVEIVLWNQLSHQEVIISGPNCDPNLTVKADYFEGKDHLKNFDFEVMIRRLDNMEFVKDAKCVVRSIGWGTPDGEEGQEYSNMAIYRGSYTFYYSFNNLDNPARYYLFGYAESSGGIGVFII